MNSEKVFQQESAEDPSCVSTQTQCRPAGVSGCCGRKEPLGERGRGRGKAGVAVRRSGGDVFFFLSSSSSSSFDTGCEASGRKSTAALASNHKAATPPEAAVRHV